MTLCAAADTFLRCELSHVLLIYFSTWIFCCDMSNCMVSFHCVSIHVVSCLRNFWLHSVHLNGLSPVWMIIISSACQFMLHHLLKFLVSFVQLNGISPYMFFFTALLLCYIWSNWNVFLLCVLTCVLLNHFCSRTVCHTVCT